MAVFEQYRVDLRSKIGILRGRRVVGCGWRHLDRSRWILVRHGSASKELRLATAALENLGVGRYRLVGLAFEISKNCKCASMVWCCSERIGDVRGWSRRSLWRGTSRVKRRRLKVEETRMGRILGMKSGK